MKYYFTKVTQDHWVPKNRLQEEAEKIARHMEGRVVREDNMDEFKLEFKTKIENANVYFHRCNPVELIFHPNYFNDGGICCGVDGVFRFEFYLIKETPLLP